MHSDDLISRPVLSKLIIAAKFWLALSTTTDALIIDSNLPFRDQSIFEQFKDIGSICSHISKSKKNGGPVDPSFCSFTLTRPCLEKF